MGNWKPADLSIQGVTRNPAQSKLLAPARSRRQTRVVERGARASQGRRAGLHAGTAIGSTTIRPAKTNPEKERFNMNVTLRTGSSSASRRFGNCNHAAMAEPYERMISGYLPRARWFCRETYGIEGAHFPHNIFTHEVPDPTICKSNNHRMHAFPPYAYTLGVSGQPVAADERTVSRNRRPAGDTGSRRARNNHTRHATGRTNCAHRVAARVVRRTADFPILDRYLLRRENWDSSRVGRGDTSVPSLPAGMWRGPMK